MSLNFYIGHKSNFTYWICDTLMIKPKIVSESEYYFETVNHKEFVADTPSLNINIDYRALYNQTRTSGTLIDCISLYTSKQEELKVIIYRKDTVSEISCNAAFLFRYKSIQEEIKPLYTVAIYKINELGKLKEVERIALDPNIELISFLKYSSPKTLLVDTKDTSRIKIAAYSYPSNPLLHSNSDIDCISYHNGFNRRLFPLILGVQVSEKDLTLIFDSNKNVFSREFTVISHASFDPGPEERTEYTDWLVRGIMKFFSITDLRHYIQQKNIRPISDGCHYNKSIPKFPYSDLLYFYSESYITPSFNSLEEAEKFLSIKLTEQWKWGEY